MLALGFVIAKFLGFSAEQGTENHSHSCFVVDTGSPCPSSLFLVVSRCLGSAHLWVGWKQSRSFVQCSERLEKLVTDPVVSFSLFFSQQGKMSQAAEFPLAAKQCWPRGRDDANKMQLFLLFLWAIFKCALLHCWRFLDLFSLIVSCLIVRQQNLESPLWCWVSCLGDVTLVFHH